MRCKNCDSNFRTIHIPDYMDRICYKCKHNNGTATDEEQEGK